MMLEISSSVLEGIRGEAAASPGAEICGLLFGERGRIDAHALCANVAEHAVDSFEIDPSALIAAYRVERGGGRAIVGCYHSHPGGSAYPSKRDADAAAANGWYWLIVADDAVEAYRASGRGAIHKRFDPVVIRVGAGA